jgi:hypothetical protein
MTLPQLYLKFPNKSQLAVTVHLVDDGLLVQGVNRPDVQFILYGVSDVQIKRSPAAQAPKTDVLRMTPADVVRYFEQSPILSYMVEDVRTAVLSHPDGLHADLQLESDLRVVQDLVEPSQADIAERLFGDRTKTGGAYRRRILAVLDATTTRSEGSKVVQSERRVA